MLQGKAKVFWSGPSQAVRLPKAFRLTTTEVTVKKVGNTLILEPAIKRKRPKGYAAGFAHMPADFRRPKALGAMVYNFKTPVVKPGARPPASGRYGH